MRVDVVYGLLRSGLPAGRGVALDTMVLCANK
jgi:hypothetical protein